VKSLTGHRQSSAEVKILQIEMEGSIFPDIDQMIPDKPSVAGRTVGRKTHHLVLTELTLKPV
jgi:hypothetical protein